jgi:drebrin-like protein
MANRSSESTGPEPVKGAYQPVGKVDIAAIRAQAKESGRIKDDRPEIVKGAYEPVGKVDIGAIRAKAQKPSDASPVPQAAFQPTNMGASAIGTDEPRPLADRSAAFTQPERLTSLPKPRVSNKFGGGSTFTGTKAPIPGGFEPKAAPAAAPVGTASRTFADQGGKTPAQIWAEKKARERGQSGSGENIPSAGFGSQSPIATQTSGGGEWKSGYSGKSWAPVQTSHTGKSAGSIGQQRTGDLDAQAEEEAPQSPAGGISSIRDRFSGAPPMGAPAPGFDRSAPEPDVSNKPNRGVGIPIPGLPRQTLEHEQEAPSFPNPPPQPPRSPTPPTPEMRSSSPIRVAMPVGRGAVTDAHEEQMSPPPTMPIRSMERAAPEPEDDEPESGPDPARATAHAAAATSLGATAVETAHPGAQASGKRALVQYDYEKAEDNEIELKEGEYVTNIEMVDEDWWMGQNMHGETGLFPSKFRALFVH